MRYRTEQKSLTGEEWREKEAKLVKVFNGLDGIKVWQNKYQTFYSKNGVILELYFTSNGYNGKSVEIRTDTYEGFESIGRISEKTDIYKPSLQKKFIELANYRIQNALEEQITSRGREKLERRNKTAFTKWGKKNTHFVDNEIISDIQPKKNSYGVDELITGIYLSKGQRPKAILQAIVNSDVDFVRITNMEIEVVGNGKQTTALLEKICVTQPNTVIGL